MNRSAAPRSGMPLEKCFEYITVIKTGKGKIKPLISEKGYSRSGNQNGQVSPEHSMSYKQPVSDFSYIYPRGDCTVRI